MARQKGDGRGRLGGRAKGTPNKTTQSMRALLTKFCEEKYKDFVDTYERVLNPKERCEIYLKAQSFVTPKLNAVDLDVKDIDHSFKSELERMAEEE
jgi:hypothetical protein